VDESAVFTLFLTEKSINSSTLYIVYSAMRSKMR
jgi:hypothetical protein